MLQLFFCLLMLHCPAHAASSRTVYLNDSDMTPIYVEPGFSTLLKFDSHPEPGLVGDQDAFKIEYLKSIVAIKPLIARAQTNLFVFTKEGQFGFKLITDRGKHDDVVLVKPSKNRGPIGPTVNKTVVEIDDLMTRKIGKTVQLGLTSVTLESIATPQSRSTIILKIKIQQKLTNSDRPQSWTTDAFSISQGSKDIKIENAFFEQMPKSPKEFQTNVLILARSDEFKKGESAKLTVKSTASQTKPSKTPSSVTVPFSADFK